jgi:hypothetical protein
LNTSLKFEVGTPNYELSAAILLVQTSGQQQQPVKRKTWAESSILSGGVATALGSTYAQDYHQHTCPASKVDEDVEALDSYKSSQQMDFT